jgi:hypothetical protein
MNDLLKVVVTVPEADADMLREVIGKLGAGAIGNYSYCSFSSKGIGRFIPTDGANPTIGQVGKSEEVAEERIEVTCSKEILDKVITTIKSVHPYEEPVIDIYQLLTDI